VSTGLATACASLSTLCVFVAECQWDDCFSWPGLAERRVEK